MALDSYQVVGPWTTKMWIRARWSRTARGCACISVRLGRPLQHLTNDEATRRWLTAPPWPGVTPSDAAAAAAAAAGPEISRAIRHAQLTEDRTLRLLRKREGRSVDDRWLTTSVPCRVLCQPTAVCEVYSATVKALLVVLVVVVYLQYCRRASRRSEVVAADDDDDG